MAVDSAGRLFAAAGAGGVLVFDAGGAHVGTIATGGLPATAVAFGGDAPKRQFLFITTSAGSVLRVPVKTKPAAFPADTNKD